MSGPQGSDPVQAHRQGPASGPTLWQENSLQWHHADEGLWSEFTQGEGPPGMCEFVSLIFNKPKINWETHFTLKLKYTEAISCHIH